MLQRLYNVRRLDLASEHYLMRHNYVRNQCPDRLFPAAEFVRLSGIMDQKLVRSIISHHPERFQELSIDNVQHWGLDADGMPLIAEASSWFLHQRMRREPGIYPLGPIRGIFDPSTQYPNLKSLFLRKVASRFDSDDKFVPEADVAVYEEWATFISSVKGHLRSFTLEQATPLPGWFVRSSVHETRRPMDQRFHDHLLPLFLEAGWDCLERLEIRRVGRMRREDPIVMNEATKAAISDCVGPKVELVIEEEARRPAFTWDHLAIKSLI